MITRPLTALMLAAAVLATAPIGAAADLSRTNAVTLTAADKQLELTRPLVLRETVPVTITDSAGSSFPDDGEYSLYVVYGDTLIAEATGLTVAAGTLTGSLSLNTSEAIAAFTSAMNPPQLPVDLVLWDATNNVAWGVEKLHLRYNPYTADLEAPTDLDENTYSDAQLDALLAAKQDLDTDAVEGNLAAFDADGQVEDSGTATTAIGDMFAAVYDADVDSDIDIAAGGTGAQTAAAARTALGLAIGTNVQAYDADLTTYAGITPSANVQTLLGAADYAAFKTSLSLNSVENAALSTWAGTANITTLGTISTGTWGATDIPVSAGGTGASDAATALTNLGAAPDTYAETSYNGGNVTGTWTIDYDNGTTQYATVTGNITTITTQDWPAGASSIAIRLTNGGDHTITWTGINVPGGTAPTLTSSGIDWLVFITIDGGTTVDAMLSGSDMQ